MIVIVGLSMFGLLILLNIYFAIRRRLASKELAKVIKENTRLRKEVADNLEVLKKCQDDLANKLKVH